MTSGGEFVDGWVVAQVLGEGAYGEVRLLVHSRSGACVALKAVRGGEEGGAGAGGAAGAREAALHRALRHPNVLRCLGEREHRGVHYLFLEYAQGGELFDRIEPDAGMAEALARRYWRQLAAGLRYLHARGVAHRDIKPENLLLDHADVLKISDFGMATLFRHASRERLLARVCGTVPYAAPEVLRAARRPYRAPPADLWAAALVLVAMLAGELPWERASPEDPRFAAWSAWAGGAEGGGAGGVPGGAWRKLPAGALALLRRALRPDPQLRPTLDALAAHRWLCEDDALAADEVDCTRVWSSQPADAVGGEQEGSLSARDMDALLSHSQPARGAAGPAALEQRLVRRATRVLVRASEHDALTALTRLLAARRYRWRYLHPTILAIECGEVQMRAWAVRVRGAGEARAAHVVLEFRRSRGCGLAFKRRFAELRDALRPLAEPRAPPRDLLAPPADLSQPMDAE